MPRPVRETWNRFFFVPQSPAPVALFRIIYGLLMIANLILLRPDWLAWYGSHAWVSLPLMRQLESGTRLNLFTIIPQSDAWIEGLFVVFLLSAILLTIGCLTRVNSVIVFLCLASIHQRNLYITHGGDTFLRVSGFFLIFAPAGAALSVDRLIRIWRGKEGALVEPRPPWAQRMIQFELALLYFATFCWKIKGAPWLDGTALFYVYHLDELQRFPVPRWLLIPVLLKLGTWTALALEFSLGVLIWFRRFRYYLLAIGVLFHSSLEYSLNIPLFEWEILSAYILFVDPADMGRAWSWIRSRANTISGEPLVLLYDGSSERIRRIADLLAASDIFQRLSLIDLRGSNSKYGISLQRAGKQLGMATPAGLLEGPEVIRRLAVAVPVLWPLAIPRLAHGAWAQITSTKTQGGSSATAPGGAVHKN